MDRPTRDERVRAEKLQELGDLVSDLYEATLDRQLWPDVMLRVVKFVGGTADDLSFGEVTRHFGMVNFDEGPDEPIDKIRPDNAKLVAAISEDCPAESGQFPQFEGLSLKIAEAGSCAEWKPAEVFFNLSALADMSAAAGVGRALDGVAGAEAFDRMHIIAPHIQRAIRIGRLVESRDAMSATFACAFDGLEAAVFLIDSGGCVLHANAAARAIIAAGEVLRVGASGRLAACGAADHDFQNALGAACSGKAVPDTADSAVPLIGRDGVRFVAHVLPLGTGAWDRGGIDGTAAAALFVRKVVVPASSASEVIGKVFRLTAAEQRVLTAIVELGGVPTVATALDLSQATVKTHLVHIFEKTGVSRQQGLVKLIARYMTPLAG